MDRLNALIEACEVTDEEQIRKIYGSCPSYPTLSPKEDGAKAMWLTWDIDFRGWLKLNRMMSLIDASAGYGQPVPPASLVMPDRPVPPMAFGDEILLDGESDDADAEADGFALKAERVVREARESAVYVAAVAAYDTQVHAITTEVNNKWRPRHAVYTYKQNSLRTALRRSVLKNADMARVTLTVAADDDLVGTKTYFAMHRAAMNLMDGDAIDDESLLVIQRIQPLADSEAVDAFIQDYTIYYNESWCKLFVPTVSNPEPWCARVPERMILSTIVTCLPDTPSWETFRTLVEEDLREQKYTVATFLQRMQRTVNKNLSTERRIVPANPAPTSTGGGKHVGPEFDCFACKDAGVPAGRPRHHKPTWPSCPHHETWKKKKDRRKSKAKKSRGKGGGKKGPSAEHPCSKCQSPSHWAKDCDNAAATNTDKDAKSSSMESKWVAAIQTEIQNQFRNAQQQQHAQQQQYVAAPMMGAQTRMVPYNNQPNYYGLRVNGNSGNYGVPAAPMMMQYQGYPGGNVPLNGQAPHNNISQ